MDLSKIIKVAIPNEKITFKKGKSDTIYVYYTLRSYRRKSDNKPTSDEVCIGKKDLETGMLIPNNKYYDIFKIDQNITYTPTSIQTFGTFYFLDAISNNIHLYDDLESIFKDKSRYILTLAFYMVTRNNTMKYVNYWCEDNYNYLSTPLVNQRISEIFASITNEERLSFFKRWSKRIIEKEYIAYDVTSISSYSKSIDNVSFGYNRDGEDLPQINLGMYTEYALAEEFADGFSYFIVSYRSWLSKKYVDCLYFAEKAQLILLRENNFKRILYLNFNIMSSLNYVKNYKTCLDMC